ncbi:long-chain-fatty-acid--CoA ligase [Bacillus sp. AGMB 02131]|uniref:Long-chain-fatty-acid--CoA ligase n=1 Tax=Peribacillus faecalis TaxID=2772559 RepID=A0A927HC47_9BACI|nr:long-chain-fatty-acid--CoA ligase [Peribacillus faecalis]MBD3110450.1 long-chain-fatty-acid--CoA ligase [Peribacillus faecalis]
MFVFEQLAKHAEMQPEQAITSFQGRVTTYRDFYWQAKNLAAYFQRQGLEQGDVIAVYLHNSDYFLKCYYACQLGGFVVLPVNTKLTASELDFIFIHSEAKALLYDVRFSDTLSQLPSSLETFSCTLPIDEQFHSILNNDTSHFTQPVIDPKDTAVIFYTSGTTGKPKGVMLSGNNVKAVAEIWATAMDITSNDRMHIVAPLFHCAASHVFSIPVIYRGGTIVIEEIFSPELTMKTMETEDVTIFFGVPAMYNIMLNTGKMGELKLPSLRLFAYGAAPMPYELVKKLKALFPEVKLQNLYGQTENSPAATTLKDHYALDKIGSVGEPLPMTEVQVVDEFGKPLPTGLVGEIAVKGPQVMKGYLKNEEETKRTIKDGWLYSGDLGRFDEDGLLYIVDRKKDMIIRGGENVYPVEVEEVLYEMPAILEAAVVGIPHQIYGEVPKAYVVCKEGQSLTKEEVTAYCQTKLASYKLPVEVEFIQVLPRNASGKVLKNALRVNVNV